MNREDQDYYEDLMEMFSLEGWKIYIQKAKDELNMLEHTAVADCSNNDLWQERRGEIKMCLTIIDYENVTRAYYENVVSNEKIAEQENLH